MDPEILFYQDATLWLTWELIFVFLLLGVGFLVLWLSFPIATATNGLPRQEIRLQPLQSFPS
jgi:hypothetical protein